MPLPFANLQMLTLIKNFLSFYPPTLIKIQEPQFFGQQEPHLNNECDSKRATTWSLRKKALEKAHIGQGRVEGP